jgi:alcohol dehydrogenase
LIRDCDMRKFVSPEFILGEDARLLAVQYARNMGADKVLVVTDRGIEKAGWVQELLDRLEADRLPYAVFSEVTPNPRAEEVMAGARVYLEEDCNCIIALGGGSPIDCAKGIGIISIAPSTDILDYEGIDQIEAAGPPLICVPTTAGPAAEVSQFAVITDLSRRLKVAIISKALVPDVALLDPIPTSTMEPYLLACTAFDGLSHAFESYVSVAHSPVTDVHALEGLKLIWNHLEQALDGPDKLYHRWKTMIGGLHAGLAFSNASLGATHALSHGVGGYLGCCHGEANALLLGSIIGFNFEAAVERYTSLAAAVGLTSPGMPPDETREALVEGVEAFRKRVGIGRSLRSLGIPREAIPTLAEKATLDPCLITNPRKASLRDLQDLYEKIV